VDRKGEEILGEHIGSSFVADFFLNYLKIGSRGYQCSRKKKCM